MLKSITYIYIFSLLFFLSEITFTYDKILVRGQLSNQDMNLGAIKLSFVDSENAVFITETDIYGHFSVKLSPKKYSVHINDYALYLDPKHDYVYNFSTGSDIYDINLEAYFKNGFIAGRVLDERGVPVPFSNIEIDSKDLKKNLKTDEYGHFREELPKGIFRIYASSYGYHSHSLVRNLPGASSIPNLTIELKRKLFPIEGVVTDGLSPLEEVEMLLITEHGETLKRIYTSENGKFYFSDIPSMEKVYILINNIGYYSYRSPLMSVSEPIKDFYIPLDERNR